MDGIQDWLVRILIGAASGLFGSGMLYWRIVVAERAVAQHQVELNAMPAREAALRKEISLSSDEVWTGIRTLENEAKVDRKETGAFRETTARQLGSMLTRAELDAALAQQEQRIATIIRAALNGHGRHDG